MGYRYVLTYERVPSAATTVERWAWVRTLIGPNGPISKEWL